MSMVIRGKTVNLGTPARRALLSGTKMEAGRASVTAGLTT